MSDETIAKRVRVRTPTVLQHENVECGAAALTMVLHYHKCFVPLEQTRIQCGVSRDGCSAAAIIKTGNKHGLICKGYRLEAESLKRQKLPLIAFWQSVHFLVVDGYDKRFFYLNDPAFGRRRLTAQEFIDGYSGIAITAVPGPDFAPFGKPSNLVDELKGRLTGAREPILFLLVTSLLLVIPIITMQAIARVFIDDYLINRLSSSIRMVLWATAFIIVLQFTLTLLQQKYLLRLRASLSLSAVRTFLQHLVRLPIVFFAQRFEGNIVQQVIGNERLAKLLFGSAATDLLQMVAVICVAIAMAVYCLPLALITIVLVALDFLFIKLLLIKRSDLEKKLMMDEYRLRAVAFSAVQSIETFKATGRDDELFERWAGLQAIAVAGRQSLRSYAIARDVGSQFMQALMTIAILLSGALFIIKGTITIGSLVAFQLLAISMLVPVQRMLASASQLQEATALLGPTGDSLRYPEDPRAVSSARVQESRQLALQAAGEGVEQAVLPAGNQAIEETADQARALPRLQGYIEMNAVKFGYSPLREPLIDDFNLSLSPGSRIAIVGASGSGKSTIAKLVTGLFTPWAGEISFDHVPIGSISANRLSRSLSYVSQEISLFEGTVRENLLLWDSSMKEEDLVEAAKNAEIHDEIAVRAGGYDCPVISGGGNFSGGQAQRLEIARALVTKPSIIVLDEATAAIDPVSEEKIYANLQRLGITTIVIAHRLSAIRDCDQILVMEQGKVVQQGTHAQLIATAGVYKEMLDAG